MGTWKFHYDSPSAFVRLKISVLRVSFYNIYRSSLLTDKAQTPDSSSTPGFLPSGHLPGSPSPALLTSYIQFLKHTSYFHTFGNPVCLCGTPFITFVIWWTAWPSSNVTVSVNFNRLLEIELHPHFKAIPAHPGQDTPLYPYIIPSSSPPLSPYPD